jgi:predicted DNA-binding WGR domain protein
MPCYEFKDAKSAKFWTIIQNGTEYTVCYGKIGTDGVEQTKEFASDETCKKAYDKLVAAKVKKGYALVDGVSEDAEEPAESSDGRPKSVPAGAIKSGHEWEFAEKNAKGENHGVVTWWRLDGTRCCRTEYVNGKPHGSFQRFHENGQVSREGTFAQGKLVGLDRFHRSSEKTSEHFAVYSAGKRVWTAENDLDKGVRRFFDKDGELCDQKGKKIVVAPEVEDGFPEHWRAPQKSTEVQEWEPSTFKTELRNGVFFTEDLRRVIFPRHGGVKTAVRPVPSVKVAWAALRRAMWACDNAIFEHAHSSNQSARSTIWSAVIAQNAKKRSYGMRMLNQEHQAATFDEDLEISRGLFRRYNGVSVHHIYSVATYERAADYFVASRGLGDAAVLLMRGIEDELPY